MKLYYLIFLYLIYFLFYSFNAFAENDILVQPDEGTLEFLVFRSDIPDITDKHVLKVRNPGHALEAYSELSFTLDDRVFNCTCDGQRYPLPFGSTEQGDFIQCTIDTSSRIMPGTSASVSIQYTYPYIYSTHHDDMPSSIYPSLFGTDEYNPYCETDNEAAACKWQKQNANDESLTQKGVPLNDWIVYSSTEVIHAMLGWKVNTEPFRINQVLCFDDTDHSGRIEVGEYLDCYMGDPDYLCPINAIECYPTVSPVCPYAAAFDPIRDRCYRDPDCPEGGVFNQSDQWCVTSPDANDDCPDGYSPYQLQHGEPPICVSFNAYCEYGRFVSVGSNRYCDVSDPQCTTGIFNPQYDSCYPNGYPCPHGSRYDCITTRSYPEPMCSDIHCDRVMDPSVIEGSEDKIDEGPIDSQGNCLGQLYIFSGKDRRCRSDGINVAFEDCCKDKDFFFGLLECSAKELDLAEKKDNDLCVYVGEYCSKRLPITKTCLEKKKTYCCYNSKLAKLVNEQGRPQLKTFSGGFGKATRPNCRGFTPEEFQVLDFSKIDLSEWYGDIQIRNQDQINDVMRSKMRGFYDSL